MRDIAGHCLSLFYPAYFERPAVFKCLQCNVTGLVKTFEQDPCPKEFET